MVFALGEMGAVKFNGNAWLDVRNMLFKEVRAKG